MTEAEKYFAELTAEISDVMPGKMFGALCMKTANGKSAAMFWKDNIVVKLTGESLNNAMNLDGTKLFEPMEGRPMKEWVQIPFDYKNQWKQYAQLSAESVKILKKKVPKKK